MSKKPTSPTKDALRLFFRNKTAVAAAISIFVLALFAGSGILFTGHAPTEDEQARIDLAKKRGDTIDLEYNPRSMADPLKTNLVDTFEPPYLWAFFFGPSEYDARRDGKSDDGEKIYWLGTDDLGRDVWARLWAGSSISLTIGLLSVGLSVILGIALGGIAGFFGKERIRLPMLLMFLFAVVAGILWTAEFTVAGVIFGLLAGICFGFQFVVAIMGGRYKAAGFFVVVALLAGAVHGFNMNTESSTPEGRLYEAVTNLAGDSKEMTLMLRDFGSEVKEAEKNVAKGVKLKPSDYPKLVEQQVAVDKKIAEVKLAEAKYALLQYEVQMEMLERSIPEHEDRAEHLKSLDDPGAKEERAAIERAEKALNEREAKEKELNKAIEGAEKALEEAEGKEVKELYTAENLLTMRANLRKQYQTRYDAEGRKRFEELLKAKNLDGSLRYPVYRITRHFISYTILGVLLVLGLLFVAGGAHAATKDHPLLNRISIPTINVDDLVMRFTEIMMTIPRLFLILALLAFFERDIYIVMAVIGLTSWMGTTRFVRAQILTLREQDFIQASRSLGVSNFRIIWRHLVPNSMSPVLVSATLGVATSVLAESTLSFLGLGAGPEQPTWGQVLSDGRRFITDAPWLTVIPGFAILLTVLAFNLLGDGLKEAFNPKLRGR